ncbi:YfbR-like 5'-deoxynucleotidase [Clostridium perfringens]
MPFGKHLNDMRELMVVKRFQNRFMHKRRSVVEHMGSTAMISHWLCIFEKELFGTKVDVAEVLQRAINFNSTQFKTGNILNSNNKLTPSMKEAKQTIKEIAYRDYIEKTLPKSWTKDFERYIINAKDSSVEGKIIQAADLIDTILECIEEIRLHNKETFEIVLRETVESLMSVKLMSVDYVIKYILPKFKLDDRYYGDNLINYRDNIKLNNCDVSLMESFSISGEYMYQYRNLMDLMRYQNKYMFKRTSVVEHMWSVAKISQGLSIWMKDKFNVDVNLEKVLCTALAHDFSEFITGDILSTTKRMTNRMKEAVDEMEKVAFKHQIEALIPKEVRCDFEQYILYPKDDGVEGKIIAAADIIDTIYECAGEVKLGNNEIFGEILKKVTKSLLSVRLEAVDYFLIHSLKDVGLDDIEKYYGEEVYNYIQTINEDDRFKPQI